MKIYDVAIIGGGTAGVVAATQAARAGAAALLVEKEGVLGGTMVTAAVNAPASFVAWDRQVIAGIGWELVRRTLEETGHSVAEALVCKSSTGIRHVTIDRAVFAALADEAVLTAGATLLLHTMLASARLDGDAWRLELCTKTGLQPAAARVLIDCTGDANAVTLAGLEVDRSPALQPGTLVMRLGGYDPAKLDCAAIQAAFDAEVAHGRLKRSDTGWHNGRVEPLLRGRGGNCVHVHGIDGSTSEGKTAAEVEARRVMLRLMRFFRAQPGLGDFHVTFFAAECGIRETVAIRGRATITAADYESGRAWDDAVCYSHYAIDMHEEHGLTYRALKPGTHPTIPLGAMVPAGSRQLLAAGRCISGDRLAHSAYRVQATCMATGQAAGAAAALACRLGCDVADVPLGDLRSLLAQQGAIVPGVHPMGRNP
jgi:NADPH-dependent 2,4-dienoyl-CoA reductase/sulfur reductase-like enzyme